MGRHKDDTESLVQPDEKTSRRRFLKEQVTDPNYDKTLPYGGKIFMARKKMADSWLVTTIEVVSIFSVIGLCIYCYFHFDNAHYHVSKVYAHLGYPHAQHIVGQRLLHGAGIDKDHGQAMEWFRKSSDQGHPHAAYNLAVGYLKGMDTDVKPGEAHRLIHHAAKNGVQEALETLNDVCVNGGCE